MNRPLCGRCEAGWLYSDDGESFTRCPCRVKPSPEQARDEAMAAAALAHPDAFNDAVRIIRDEAQVSLHLSANTVRAAMEAAQIPGPVVGAAFRKCRDEGWIEPDGDEKSELPNTKAHRLFRYRSRLYATQLGVGA